MRNLDSTTARLITQAIENASILVITAREDTDTARARLFSALDGVTPSDSFGALAVVDNAARFYREMHHRKTAAEEWRSTVAKLQDQAGGNRITRAPLLAHALLTAFEQLETLAPTLAHPFTCGCDECTADIRRDDAAIDARHAAQEASPATEADGGPPF